MKSGSAVRANCHGFAKPASRPHHLLASSKRSWKGCLEKLRLKKERQVGLHVDIPGEGLEIKTGRPTRETQDGKDSVEVRGIITTISDSDKPVPVILINAFDGKGQKVQSEKTSPAKSQLKPGEKSTLAQ